MLGIVPSITETTVLCSARVVQEPTAPTPKSATILTITMAQSRALIVKFMNPPIALSGLLIRPCEVRTVPG